MYGKDLRSSVLTQRIIQGHGIVIAADRFREQMRLPTLEQIGSGGHLRVPEKKLLFC